MPPPPLYDEFIINGGTHSSRLLYYRCAPESADRVRAWIAQLGQPARQIRLAECEIANVISELSPGSRLRSPQNLTHLLNSVSEMATHSRMQAADTEERLYWEWLELKTKSLKVQVKYWWNK